MVNRSSRLPSRFFKIIMDPQADRLEIPPEFMKRHGRNLASRVFLKVPAGPTIEAEVVQCNSGKTWLGKGWREFKQCCSVGFGHFIVFEYNKKAEFTVIIFDMSAVEVNYTMLKDNGLNSDSFPVGRPKVENQETNEKFSSCYEKDQHSNFPLQNVCVKRKLGCSKKLQESNYEKCGRGVGGKFLTRAKRQQSTVYRKAAAFSTRLKNPFHIGVMTPSSVSHGFCLSLPISFARQNVPQEGINVIMMVFEGKQWPVKCVMRTSRACLSGGWVAFAKGNGLKLGDACVFEVVNTLVWNVEIFRSE